MPVIASFTRSGLLEEEQIVETGGGRRKGQGRPPKFAGPSRVITVTLPEKTLADLELIDQDRARAIVRATNLALSYSQQGTGMTVDLHEASDGTALITVPFTRVLDEIEGMRLVEILPSRFLVILDPGVELPALELALIDRMEIMPPEPGLDRLVLKRLIDHLRSFRRSARAQTASVVLVSLTGGVDVATETL